jgi:hypothetical protein
MDDEPLSPEIQDAAQGYNRPPETPREEIWAAVQAGKRAGGGGQPAQAGTEGTDAARVPARPPARLPLWLGIAAALALAFGLGRLSNHETHWAADPPLATGPGARSGTVAFQVAAVEHLGQAESFLTLFRASVRSGARDGLAAPTARQLLATNRLMLDSPASADPKLRLLLEDLELVLAGIAQISPGRATEELDIITNDLERNAVLLRLRAAVPAGGGALARPGAL